jgi:hypothetical protein
MIRIPTPLPVLPPISVLRSGIGRRWVPIGAVGIYCAGWIGCWITSGAFLELVQAEAGKS